MEKTEELVQELAKKKESFAVIENEEWAFIGDHERREQLITLLLAERILPTGDSRIKSLSDDFSQSAREFRAKREAHHREYARIAKELSVLTGPVIRTYMEELTDLGAKPKFSREVLGKKYDGLRKQTILTINTNEKAIRKIHELVKEAIGKIQSMTLSPISEIRTVFIEAKSAIGVMDWHQTEKVKIDEVDFFKGSPPLGSGTNFGGPLSGLEMPPPKLLEVQNV